MSTLPTRYERLAVFLFLFATVFKNIFLWHKYAALAIAVIASTVFNCNCEEQKQKANTCLTVVPFGAADLFRIQGTLYYIGSRYPHRGTFEGGMCLLTVKCIDYAKVGVRWRCGLLPNYFGRLVFYI